MNGIKIGPMTLEFVIPCMVWDKGGLTKAQVFNYLKRIEITDKEFNDAWRFSYNMGFIREGDREKEEEKEVWRYRAQDMSNMERWIPQMWDVILGESLVKTYTYEISCRERDHDKF